MLLLLITRLAGAALALSVTVPLPKSLKVTASPGLLIWHSKDLINWLPVAAALHRYYERSDSCPVRLFGHSP